MMRPVGRSLLALLEPRYREEPDAFYRLLADEPPVYWDAAMRAWTVHRHADAVQVLRDPRFSARRLAIRLGPLAAAGRARARPVIDAIHRQMLFCDPPDHTRLRALAAAHFTSGALDTWVPAITALAHELCGEALAQGGMEAMAELAEVLPVAAFCRILGLPSGDERGIRAWSRDVFAFFNGSPYRGDRTARGLASIEALLAYFARVAEHGHADQDGLFAVLGRAAGAADLARLDLLSNYVFLLGAAHETTTSLIGSAMLRLARDPVLGDALRADPARVGGFVTELLRCEPPVQITHRRAAVDLVLHDAPIAAGEIVAIALGAANHDPDVYRDPFAFDPTRRGPRPLSFGHGLHYCLGAVLARLETEILIGAVTERLPRLTLGSERLEWNEALFLRRLIALHVTV
jgi:cytochrome P450